MTSQPDNTVQVDTLKFTQTFNPVLVIQRVSWYYLMLGVFNPWMSQVVCNMYHDKATEYLRWVAEFPSSSDASSTIYKSCLNRAIARCIECWWSAITVLGIVSAGWSMYT